MLFGADSFGPAQPGFSLSMLNKPQESENMLNIVACLNDQKFIMLRCILTRPVFEKYFLDYDHLYRSSLESAIEGRGLTIDNFHQMLGLYIDHPAVAKIQKEINQCKGFYESNDLFRNG
jgi:hypothetical protein